MNSSKNVMEKTRFGVGFLGGTKYKTKENGKPTKNYIAWSNMLQRCYKPDLRRVRAYSGCTVSNEWLNFQDFSEWFFSNYHDGYHLDKDIVVKGNKLYSPETCRYIPQEINKLFTKSTFKRGKYPIGVHAHKDKFIARINNGKGRVHLGIFDTIEEAFQAYKTAKEAFIKVVAERWKGKINTEVYEAMINYKVDITD